MKKPNHRPSEYKEKYVDDIYKYMEEAVPENMQIPTVEGFALRVDVTKKTLYNWSKKNKDFLHALRILKMKQRETLISIGIFGGKEINSNVVMLLLKVNHDMVEKNKTDLTTNGKRISPVMVRFLDKKDEMQMPSELIDKYDISSISKK